ncbi:hypothetical protein HYC85_012530 [Camellia sinensis]|uniref:FRIGIDA-like protein n=1 Tax=Camellia sinensis TaxID=4442 RepID=A0A7J7HDE4_CAMSI|nr:hypothetical protein HYC85_012530 [Camellia sinensis]
MHIGPQIISKSLVWDVATGSKQYTFEGHQLPVYSVCPHTKENIQNNPLFSCGTSKEGESYIVEWNESEGAVKRTYHGLGKRSVGVVQFDTTKNRFLAAGDEFVIKFWDMDNVNLLTTTNAEGGLPICFPSFWITGNDKTKDMIEELINRGQQVDAVHSTFEVGLEGKFPPVPLLKAFLNDAKKAADSILEDPNNSDRAAHLAARKEQSALRAVIKCVEEYKLEAEFPSKNLRKRLDQLEKSKTEKKKPAAVSANKRTRVNSGGPMPPAKAGRSTNAYVSSFPAAAAYVRSPSHAQYPVGVPLYPAGPAMYGSRSPPTNPYAYSPEAAPPLAGSYQVAPVNYSPYGGYGNEKCQKNKENRFELKVLHTAGSKAFRKVQYDEGCRKGVTPKYSLKPLVPRLSDIKPDIDVEKMFF